MRQSLQSNVQFSHVDDDLFLQKIIVHGNNPHPEEEVAVVHVQLHVETAGLGGAGNKVT